MAKKKAMPKTYKGKSTKPGGGGQFAMMVDAMTKKGMPKAKAAAITAKTGVKKFGQKKMTQWAVAGKKRAAKKKAKK
jgi:hypothetical protein